MARRACRFTLFVLPLALSACSVYRLPEQVAVPVEEAEPAATSSAPSAPATSADTSPPPGPDSTHSEAYRPLLAQADSAAARGDYEQALALLERALRLDTDNAEIYLAMAEVHCARGALNQCRAVAERGLLYCRGASQCEALRSLSTASG
ncbi:MAG: tetratricopeptide repeat protein [Pseudomonadota bacterium]